MKWNDKYQGYLASTEKEVRKYINLWLSYQGRNLNDVYAEPSQNKVNAWNYVMREYVEPEGSVLVHIPTHSCQFYTMAWQRKDWNLAIKTPTKHIIIQFENIPEDLGPKVAMVMAFGFDDYNPKF